MRVIAGTARGVRLAAPVGMQTRPTADRVKEALFSIISSRHEFEDARILDICAGTGGLGIEALSRGAATCCFIEHDRNVLKVLERNLLTTGFVEKTLIVALDAVKGLLQLSLKGTVFDIVFFDPPYSSNLYPLVIEALSSLSLLSDNALLVAECSSRVNLADQYGMLLKMDRRVYGDTALEFFAREPQ